jgi:hypothetical protein
VKIGSTNKLVLPIYNQPGGKVKSASNLYLGISHTDTERISLLVPFSKEIEMKYKYHTKMSLVP